MEQAKKWCIYQITNNINHKRYIGKHGYFDGKNPMGKYKGSGKLLKKAYKKHGIENFSIEILCFSITSNSLANSLEKAYIREFEPEYNIAAGGDGNVIWTDEMRKDLSDKCKGRKHTKETKKKMSNYRKTHHNSGMFQKGEPSRFKGVKRSDEFRKKDSDALKKYYETHEGTFKGRQHTEETKKKLSEIAKKRPHHLHTDITKEKISNHHNPNSGTKGMRCYNNGIVNKYAFECPEGFVLGKIKRGRN